jgi:hypothetical protein
LVNLGDVQRLNIKSINVETAKIAASYAGDIANSARVKTLLAAGGGAASGSGGTAPTASGVRTAAPTQAAAPAVPDVKQAAPVPAAAISTPPPANPGNPQGLTPQGNTIEEQLLWIAEQTGIRTVYEIVVNNDVFMGPAIVYTQGRNITVIIRSANPASVKNISLQGQGHLFTVESDVTLRLQDIVLRGQNNNNGALVRVNTGGRVILDSGSKITQNNNSY